MRFNFNLRQVKDENKETPIYLVMSINGRQEKFATGQKVCPKFWEKGKSLAIVSNTQPRKIQQHNKSVNDELSKITAKIQEWEDYLYDHPEQESNAASILRDFISNERESLETPPLIWFEQAIKEDYNTKESSKNKYLGDLNSLNEFVKERHIRVTSFSNINYSFVKKFEGYMFDKGWAINTIICKMRTLLTVINKAEKCGLINTTNAGISRYQLPRNKEDDNQIYLTEEELKKLEAVALSGNEEHVRDIFLLQCQLGQRYSDMMNLNNAIIEEEQITLVQEKTAKKVIIPLNDTAKRILRKYGNKLPEIRLEYANMLLKSIGKKAGIDTVHLIKKQLKGNTTSEKVPKYELLTTHTARRTFVTISLKRGIQPNIIMKITGHTSSKTMERYDKMSAEDVAEILNMWDSEEDKINKEVEKKVAERLVEEKGKAKKEEKDEIMNRLAINLLTDEDVPLNSVSDLLKNTFEGLDVTVSDNMTAPFILPKKRKKQK